MNKHGADLILSHWLVSYTAFVSYLLQLFEIVLNWKVDAQYRNIFYRTSTAKVFSILHKLQRRISEIVKVFLF